MNIQTINFTGKQRFEYHKPRVSQSDVKTNPSTLEVAVKQYEKQTFASMVEQAQLAFKTAPTIQNASKQFQKESRGILYEAGKIQTKAIDLMGEIIDTRAFNKYCSDVRNKKPFSSYMTEIEFQKERYEVLIGQHRICAIKTTDGARDIYIFDTTDRSLVTFVKNQKNMPQGKVADAEYHFDNEELSQCDLKVAKGEVDLISKRFKYNTDRKENTLSSVLTMVRTSLENNWAERIFEYDSNGKLCKYLRGFKEDVNCKINADIYYEFEQDGSVAAFKKDMIEDTGYSRAKLYAEYKDQDDFYVQADYDSRKDVEYSALCFYQNGKIEGSII